MAIDFMSYLWCRGHIDFVIVLAPKGVHRQWVDDQIPEHSPVPFTAYYWSPGRVMPWTSYYQGAHDKLSKAQNLIWHSINYDAIKTPKGGNAIAQVNSHGLRFGLVLDESHLVKNYRTKRWEVVKQLADHPRCKSRLLLSGTPLTKDLVDEYSQLKIADEDIVGIRYVTHFRNEYCIYGGYNQKQFVGPRNLTRYRQLTGPFISRINKSDHLDDLPSKLRKRWRFNMAPKQEVHLQ